MPNHSTKHDTWLIGGGAMGELLRNKDWSQSPLGPIEQWPSSLRTTVSLILNSNFPISLAWGPSHTQIYNDGYAPLCGSKHPAAIGEDFTQTWASAFPVIGAAYHSALAGTTGFLEDQRMFIDRLGFLEEVFFTFSFSPIRDETGAIVGLFHPVTETTTKNLGERRTRCLRDLAEAAAECASVVDGFASAAQILEAFRHDIPFALFYAIDPGHGSARLVGRTGLEPSMSATSPAVELADPASPWPLSEVVRSGHVLDIDDLVTRFGPLVCGEYPEPVVRARLMPICLPGDGQVVGVMIAGFSPRLPGGEGSAAFHEMLHAAIVSTTASAHARQTELERAQALAEIERAKTELLSNISHEFRTPLSLILGPLEEVLSQPSSSLTTPERESLEAAHRNAMRLLKLVNTLLDFSRLQAGRTDVLLEETDLASLTAELASNFRSACERAGIRLLVDCTPLGEPVYVDRSMWEKIVLNLVSNALKFTFAGTIEVRLTHEADVVRLSVRDTGIGIPQTEVGRIFERFHRVKGAAGRTHEGSGIGLALVNELALLHGGRVAVESTEGVGSEFTVTLSRARLRQRPDGPIPAPTYPRSGPAALFVREAEGWLGQTTGEQHEASDRTGSASASAGLGGVPRPRILWADDNSDMRAYVERLLAPAYEVEAVADGEAALRAARRKPPDLVLSDVMMPKLDGFGLLRALREDEAMRTIPVVLLSARSGDEARIEGHAAGANEYLVKPFSARELLAVIKSQVQQARLRREVASLQLAGVLADAERASTLAEARSQAKSAFLANMSHEIRTPMNAIVGLTHLVRKQTRDPQQCEHLDKIDHAARHLLQVINDILDLAKIEAGKTALEEVPFDLDEVVSRTFDMVREPAAQKGIELAFEGGRVPTRLVGDPTRIAQALLNLLSNAVKFTQVGWIVLRCSAQPEGGDRVRVRFEVEDTGQGVEAEHLTQLFMPFEQADNSITRRFGGTGLGLALTRRFAELMGGDAGATSQPDRGSIFWFSAVLRTTPADEVSPVARPLVGRRALLLAGLPVSSAAIGAQLMTLGLRVDCVADAESASARVAAASQAGSPYAVLVIDDHAGGEGDRTALERLLGADSGRLPPCVLLSDGREMGPADRSPQLHVAAIVLKPSTCSALWNALASILHVPRPTPTAAPVAAVAEAELRQRHRGRRILLVEDNEINQEVAQELLRSVSLVVETANDGLEAIGRVGAERFDLVLMDMQMPGMDGVSASRAIRAMIGPRLPIIAMTANAAAEDREACLAAGMDDFLTKPVEPERLFEVLLKWLPKPADLDLG